MHDIFYSDDAINVRSAFFDVDVIIYVEGDDDVLFWSDIFSRVAPTSRFEIEPANGADNLDEYIKKIQDGTINAIAARDADFLEAHGKMVVHPRVIYTAGYSIENSLYTSDVLLRLLQSWCKSNKIKIHECEEWLINIKTNFFNIICLDIANSLDNAGAATMGDNCTKFMRSQTSHIPCHLKINCHIEKTTPLIRPEKIEEARNFMQTKDHFLLIRGHFLASAVIKFIAQKAGSTGKKTSISAQSLYSAAIANFSQLLDKNHPHKDFYLASARVAWESL